MGRTARLQRSLRTQPSCASHSRAMAWPMPLPQLSPEAASAWLMAVAVEVAVAGLVSCCCSCWGLVLTGVSVLAVLTGAGVAGGLQP